jgi:ABC-type antimicrobial peptide transport system permease subunit
MFITYLLRELRRRMRQAIFTAAGLALGIGLVITVMAASSGVSASQAAVLKSLYGVGTDITVTKSPTAGSGGAPHFRFGTSQSGSSKKASVNRNVLTSGGLGTLTSSSVTKISGQKDVEAVAGALVLNDLKLSGSFSAGSSRSGSAGSGGGAPTSGAFNANTFSVTGIDPSHDSLGPLSSGTITSGHSLSRSEANANVAVVDSDYAKENSLKVGSTLSVAGKSFTVVGIVKAAEGVTDSDVYIPLARAQALADMKGEVNTIYVSTTSAADVTYVSHEIATVLPGTTVTTSSSLASDITGSLSSASTLANSLGRWLAVAVLAAAFCLASILTVSAVSRRVREFGTLKAIGWSSPRIIRQVMGEALVIGVVGGVAGVAIGYGASAIISAVSPSLSASVGTGGTSQGPGAGAGGRPGGFGHAASSAAQSIAVHLTAPVTLSAIALAVLLAIAGGLIAGSFGGWRAVRLRPAAALSRVE